MRSSRTILDLSLDRGKSLNFGKTIGHWCDSCEDGTLKELFNRIYALVLNKQGVIDSYFDSSSGRGACFLRMRKNLNDWDWKSL